MRWRTAGLCALSLVTMTGCPEEFGKEGRVQRAVHQDVMELSRKHCSKDDLATFCGGAKKNSPECILACGEQ